MAKATGQTIVRRIGEYQQTTALPNETQEATQLRSSMLEICTGITAAVIEYVAKAPETDATTKAAISTLPDALVHDRAREIAAYYLVVEYRTSAAKALSKYCKSNPGEDDIPTGIRQSIDNALTPLVMEYLSLYAEFSNAVMSFINSYDGNIMQGVTSQFEGKSPIARMVSKRFVFAQADDRQDKLHSNSAKSPRGIAEQSGYITTIGSKNLATITDKDFRYALTENNANSAYLCVYPDDVMNHITESNGHLMLDDDGLIKPIPSDKEGNAVLSYDRQFLDALYTMIYKQWDRQSPTVTLYIPSFCREMGTSNATLQQKPNEDDRSKTSNILEKINKLNRIVGRIGTTRYRIVNIDQFDPVQNTITLTFPYLRNIITTLEGKTIRHKDGSEEMYPAHQYLLPVNAGHKQSTAGREIAKHIIASLGARGNTPDSKLKQNKGKSYSTRNNDKITIRISFRTIIENIPVLQDSYERAKATADKNKVLRRAFTAAYDILLKGSEVPKTYKDFEINAVIPSTTTLDDNLKIEHKGLTAREE